MEVVDPIAEKKLEDENKESEHGDEENDQVEEIEVDLDEKLTSVSQ